MKGNKYSDTTALNNTLDCQLANCYGELASRARSLLRRERSDHTLQTSALIHEAYLRMLNLYKNDWKNTAQFMPVSVGIMRRVLVDHARNSNAQKRGGNLAQVEFHENMALSKEHVDVIALDDALERLAEFDPLQASIVEHRFFGGLTIQQTSKTLDLSPATIKRKWTIAQAWLYRELRTD